MLSHKAEAISRREKGGVKGDFGSSLGVERGFCVFYGGCGVDGCVGCGDNVWLNRFGGRPLRT